MINRKLLKENIYTIDGWEYYIDYLSNVYAIKDNIIVTHHIHFELLNRSKTDENLKNYIHKQTVQSAERLINQNQKNNP